MGCCCSRSNPYSSHSGDHPESSQAINEVPEVGSSEPTGLSRTQSITSGSRPPYLSRRRSQAVALGEHYNTPIRIRSWRSKRHVWTKVQIEREREEFFETRVTGRPEIWAALKLAVDLLRGGDAVNAQTVLDAAGITVPTGDLCAGCYDQNGALYRLPQIIVSDPTNLVEMLPEEEEGRGAGEVDDEVSSSKVGLEVESEEDGEKSFDGTRDEKGKQKEQDTIKVCARFSDREGDFTFQIGKNQPVSALLRKIQNEVEITKQHRLRIAYMGKILKENEPLLAQGWKEDHIISALVLSRPPSTS